jgi:hypothetical protein
MKRVFPTDSENFSKKSHIWSEDLNNNPKEKNLNISYMKIALIPNKNTSNSQINLWKRNLANLSCTLVTVYSNDVSIIIADSNTKQNQVGMNKPLILNRIFIKYNQLNYIRF